MSEQPLFNEGAAAVDLPATHDSRPDAGLVRLQPMAIAQPSAAPTPMMLIQMAMSQGCDPERLERLLSLQERWEAGEALKAFNKAFAAFKAESVQIVKNISVTDGPLKGKKYADLFAAVDAVTPALSKHGLSHSWKLTKDEPTWLEVTCILRHELGHSETVSMGGPPDTGGAKSAIQARASSKSYLERYTLLGITGLASSDGDNDGRGKAPLGLPEDAFQVHISAIRESPDMKTLQDAFGKAWKAAGNDMPTKKALTTDYEKRKADLR